MTLPDRFLAFSARMTAFSVYDLRGTGQAESYLATVVAVVGEPTLTELLDVFEQGAGTPRALRADILGDEKLGPIARNIIKLWYVGVWYGLPAQWSDRFGARAGDGTFTASAGAYPEGLLWRAIGANPPGARAPGYGSWASPPVIPLIPGEEEETVSVPRPRSAQQQPAQQQPAQIQPAKETAQ